MKFILFFPVSESSCATDSFYRPLVTRTGFGFFENPICRRWFRGYRSLSHSRIFNKSIPDTMLSVRRIAPHISILDYIHGGYEWNTVLLAYERIDNFTAHPREIPDSEILHIIPCANSNKNCRCHGTFRKDLRKGYSEKNRIRKFQRVRLRSPPERELSLGHHRNLAE